MEKLVQEKEAERQRLEAEVKLARERIEADGPVKAHMDQQRQIEELKNQLAEIHGFFPDLNRWLIDKRNERYQEEMDDWMQSRGMRL